MKDEFAFISMISPKVMRQSSLEKGIGDDAAVYKGSEEMNEVVCVDTVVEGVHFLRKTLSPFQLGKKALAMNISDLAAMGAIPAYYLVSIAIPQTWQTEELEQIFAGMAKVAECYKMDLIGGDTVSTEGPLILTVTAIGRVESGRALYRNYAQPGDLLFVTGDVGSSAAGLDFLLYKDEIHRKNNELVLAHQEPEPHVEQGRILLESQARVALNDVSDGVASEAHELAEASHVDIVIDEHKIPLHQQMQQFSREKSIRYALFGGEDYVLIGTIGSEDRERVERQFHKSGHTIYFIGQVKEGSGNVYLQTGQQIEKIEKKGYNHFR